jgi:hypothetical protein
LVVHHSNSTGRANPNFTLEEQGLTWAQKINDLDVSADAKPLGARLVVGLPV